MDKDERRKNRLERRRCRQDNPGNRLWSGILLFAAGGLLMARQLGANIPDWMFHWHMVLIAIGLLISFKSGFRNAGGLIMIVVGIAFLLNDIIPNAHMQDFIWPGILIIAGIVFMIKPRHQLSNRRDWDRHGRFEGKWNTFENKFSNADDLNKGPLTTEMNTDENAEYVEINAVFGSVNKLILSKNFKGGEINAFMGGAEINLLQADILKPVQLEVNTVFGGAKLIVPGNWDIKNEITAVFGGVEDKRSTSVSSPEPGKTIIIKGACVFGGIEIRNF